MKILLVSGDNPYTKNIGGKHIHQLLLEKGLVSQHITVNTIYPDFPHNKVMKYLIYLKDGILSGDPTLFSPPNKLQVLSLINQLKQRLSSVDLDSYSLVHCQDVVSAYAFDQIFPDATLPKILTLHGYFAREAVDYSKIQADRNKKDFFDYCFSIEKQGVLWSDQIISVDTRIHNYIIDEFQYPSSRIFVLPNATDTDTFHSISESEKIKIRESLGYGKDLFIIIVPRRLVPKNGVRFAVLAMKQIKDGNVRLLILGDGPQGSELVGLARDDQRIQFLGAIPHTHIDEYYKMSDVVVIPSITSHDVQEATSLSMLEGMSCGKIVVCSCIGGMKEVIEDGKTGFLVSEQSPDEIADVVTRIHEGSVNTELIGQQAEQYVVEHHSYISHAETTRRVYEKILSVHNG